MITETDYVDLPDGVSLADGQVADAVRGCQWPLNRSGAFVLGCTGRPLDAVVREFAKSFDLSLEVARLDVLQFVWTLNALALVNIGQHGSRVRRSAAWLGLALRLAPAGALPAPITRRRGLDTESVIRGVVSTFSAVATRIIATTLIATMAIAPLVAASGGRADVIVLGLALAGGTGIGIGLHEAGHVASLRGIPSALVLRGGRTYVLHAPLGKHRRSIVAISGPATAVATGLVLVVSGAAVVAPTLVILGLPFAAHALSLTVIGCDGRSACGI